ncbi:MAG TPA: hypothetical protein VEX43_08850, partial [Chthoniobacterales bacterium]|nr:hypothetical protein [Chthoniobacterales bacterium]
MSYLNIPRLHFTGKFQADPSTVNNNDANWDPTTQLSNDQTAVGWVYWNPTGTHNWKLHDCTVRGAANDQGQFTAPSSDPIIGARVLSSGQYPAKLVDLDPDNQSVSQIWGLEVQVSIADPTDATKVLASVTGTMSTFTNGEPVAAAAFGDLWNRATNAPGPGMSTMGAAFHGVLTNIAWVNSAASPLLAALQAISPNTLSIRFNVDSFQPRSTQSNFTFGRVVGTIGPTLAGDAPRSTPRRLAPVYSTPSQNGSYLSILSTFGPAGAAWDAQRSVLILDLGNCVPTVWSQQSSGPSVPDTGWPCLSARLQVTCGGTVLEAVSPMGMKSGAAVANENTGESLSGAIAFDTALYLTFAGIVEIAVPNAQVQLVLSSALTITNLDAMQTAVQEDPLGRYVDVDVPFFRLNPGDSVDVTLWATVFGQPWTGVTLPVALQPVAPAANGNPMNFPVPPVTWNNNDPPGALTLSTSTPITGADGTAVLQLKASDPGTPRTYSDGQPGPDGQVYGVTSLAPIPNQPPGSPPVFWPALGQIFLFSGSPINV